MGSGKANLGENRTNSEDVSLPKGLKSNIISMSQMVDGGKELVFNSKGCYIRKGGLEKVIDKGVKTPNNLYVLKGRRRKEMRSNKYSSYSYSK